jgi:predicted flap endonuclease-1-like 5' DNA nuclease
MRASHLLKGIDMTAFSCCIWWFLLGLLAGFVLNWLLQRWLRKDESAVSTTSYMAMPAVPRGGGVDQQAAAMAGFIVKGEDDLPIIEGIGPKISDLLKANGVSSFARLGAMSVPEISAVLEKGGARFKLANPGSWAEQARLCADNRWAELRRLQDRLYAGVAASDSQDGHNL